MFTCLRCISVVPWGVGKSAGLHMYGAPAGARGDIELAPVSPVLLTSSKAIVPGLSALRVSRCRLVEFECSSLVFLPLSVHELEMFYL